MPVTEKLMLVGNNYTRFVIFLAKTMYEIGSCAALVTRYEGQRQDITQYDVFVQLAARRGTRQIHTKHISVRLLLSVRLV